MNPKCKLLKLCALIIRKVCIYLVMFLSAYCLQVFSQTPIADNETVIRPNEIQDVLTNPGMGFMTFQRFNGDALNEGIDWTEGLPIDYIYLPKTLQL